ncbi:MAG: PIN domain-containing protein [Bifidobacteriaceae bacterium]|jgi:predicted nucleic acid-binding protein|nr:PIN domain-containing protein [Bifidobacteriaceae bacterium]
MSGAVHALDTSVSVPLCLASHPLNDALSEWAKGKDIRLTAHSLAEAYAVLTRLPGGARLAPEHAASILEDGFGPALAIDPRTAVSVHRRLAEAGIAGGAVFDALIALTALEHQAVLVSRDIRAKATYALLGVNALAPLP